MPIDPKFEESIRETIVQLYQSGVSVANIAEEIEGATPTYVRKVLKEYGVLAGPGRKPNLAESMDEATTAEMLKDYYAMMPINELIEKYQIGSKFRFYTILHELGQVARVNSPEVVEGKKAVIDVAIELYQKGLPIWRIKEETGVDQTVLHNHLHKRHIPLRRDIKRSGGILPKLS